MELLFPVFIAAAFLGLSYLLMRAVIALEKLSARRKILSYGKAAEDTVAALLVSHFGPNVILTNRYLPYRTKNGTAYTEVDCIAVLRGAVAAIEVKSLVGSIRNPDTELWHQSAVTRDGDIKELDFTNPILQNERHILSLVGIFEKERISPKPRIENLVIFTSDKVSFARARQSEIYSLSSAIERLKELNRIYTLSGKERYAILRSIKKHAKPKRAALRINRRVLGKRS